VSKLFSDALNTISLELFTLSVVGVRNCLRQLNILTFLIQNWMFQVWKTVANGPRFLHLNFNHIPAAGHR